LIGRVKTLLSPETICGSGVFANLFHQALMNPVFGFRLQYFLFFRPELAGATDGFYAINRH
jgi:hypothetical protein